MLLLGNAVFVSCSSVVTNCSMVDYDLISMLLYVHLLSHARDISVVLLIKVLIFYLNDITNTYSERLHLILLRHAQKASLYKGRKSFNSMCLRLYYTIPQFVNGSFHTSSIKWPFWN